MAQQETSKFCPACNQQRLVRKPGMSIHWLIHAVLFLATWGVWLIVWIIDGVVSAARPWRCSVCGKEIA